MLYGRDVTGFRSGGIYTFSQRLFPASTGDGFVAGGLFALQRDYTAGRVYSRYPWDALRQVVPGYMPSQNRAI